MESFRERSRTTTITPELAREVAGSMEELLPALSEYAETVENSFNCVIEVNKDHTFGVELRCIRGVSADPEIADYALQTIQSMVFRELDKREAKA